jgi:valyl-tRNA synthetase
MSAQSLLSKNLDKNYDPKRVEQTWSTSHWNQFGLYHAHSENVLEHKKSPYTILMPPPNVTGSLTIGHVLNHTIQDIFIRYNRMMQKEALWLPGTDHAGIATQTVVEKKLRKQKITRYDLGREKFLDEVWQWRDEYGNLILQQLERLGISCDWRRNLFTMDESASEAVINVFVKLYRDGLIYKGKRIINWCPVSHTALSDEEVIMKTQTDPLTYVRYKLADQPDKFITIATVRPETILADVAIAVNPNDDRYKSLIGTQAIVPIANRKVPIIADDYVEIEFGTGALKITPAHDPNDYAVAQRHNLPVISVIGQSGEMTDEFGYKGMDRFDARKKITEDLQAIEAIEKIEDYEHNVGYSERAGVVVEPFLSEQWFVKMKTLAEPALKVVEEGKIKFHPAKWKNTYRHWMENIQDWCISRQLWWGHRIPAWYDSEGNIFVAHNAEEAKELAGNKELTRDSDVLDTWFSSWLWPMTTLRWKGDGDCNNDFKAFYPTSTLVTGPDIIFFWVARMIMAGLYFKGDVPYRDVYFTSIIRDMKGRKLSKSLGNSPDPLKVMDDYGTDALRFTVIYLAPLGQDVLFGAEKCEQGRNFATKIWNAARFLFMNRNEVFESDEEFETLYRNFVPTIDGMNSPDRWIYAKLNQTLAAYHQAHENFRVNDITKQLYEFIWSDFCDWYLELMKVSLQNATSDAEKKQQMVHAIYVFETALKALHPVMPFITEEIWQTILSREEKESISLQEIPESNAACVDEKALESVEFLKKMITECRSVRSVLGVPPSTISKVKIKAVSDERATLLEESAIYMERLARSEIEVSTAIEKPSASAGAVVDGNELYILLEGLIDLDKEKARLEKEIQKVGGYVKQLQGKLSNEKFVANAPKEVVEGEREKLKAAELNLEKLTRNLESLN